MKYAQIILFILPLFFLACGPGSQESQTDEEMADTTQTEAMTTSLTKTWETDTVFNTPESVLYFAEEDVIFVSNVGGDDPASTDGIGFISKLNPDGTVMELEWAGNMDAPKGMGIYDGMLYVTDITRIHAVDLASGDISETWSIDTAQFLNDITVSDAGEIYVSDSYGNAVYRLANGDLSVFLSGEQVASPNGLNAQPEALYMGTIADSSLYKIDYNSKEMTHIASGFGLTDGVEIYPGNGFLVSDWHGRLFHVSPEGEVQLLLNSKSDGIHSADIDYVAAKQLLLVPTFFDNRVVAYGVE